MIAGFTKPTSKDSLLTVWLLRDATDRAEEMGKVKPIVGLPGKIVGNVNEFDNKQTSPTRISNLGNVLSPFHHRS